MALSASLSSHQAPFSAPPVLAVACVVLHGRERVAAPTRT
jgi:hypothetical protein